MAAWPAPLASLANATGGSDRRFSTQPELAGAPPGDHRHVRSASSPDAGTTPRASPSSATANDLGKGALYHYIGSKEELLAAIHDRVMDEVMVGADRVAEAGGSPSQQLAMLGDELLDVIHRYPDHVWVFLHEFPALTGERAEQFRERRAELRAAGRGGPPGRRRVGRVP